MNADLLPLALAAALYPLLLAAAVVMLRAQRPTPSLLGYLVGGMVLSVGIGLVIVFALGASGVDQSSRGTLSPTVDLVAGGLLLVSPACCTPGAIARLRRRRKKPEKQKKEGESWTQRHLGNGSPRTAVLVGMALSLPSVYYLTALKDIAAANDGTAERVGLVLAFNLVAFALIEVPLVCFLVSPERTRATLTAHNDWVGGHTRQIGEVAALVLGDLPVVRGVTQIVG